MKPIQGPIICTSLEKNALSFVENSVSAGEPCSLIGIGEMAQEVLYRELEELLSLKFPEYKFLSHFLTSQEDVEKFKSQLNEDTSLPTILLMNIATPEDVSPIMDYIDARRLKRSIHFISVILSDTRSLYEAIRTHKKSIARSLFVLNPLNTSDISLLLASFVSRFDFSLDEIQKKSILRFGTGYFGLTKSLFLLQKQYPKQVFTIEWLLQEASIMQRLTTLANQLPLSLLKTMVFNPSHLSIDDSQFLEKFGYMKNGTLVSPLLESFLKKTLTNPDLSLNLILSEIETTTFTFLKKHIGEVVMREDLAQAIWKDNWEEKYSDWAIDQLIHRVREKLEKTNSPLEIITKKGEGFYLQQKKY